MPHAGAGYVVFGRDPTPCLADTNGDNALSPANFSAWILNFNAGCP